MAELPKDINEIIESIAEWARGYNNRLKWNEVDKLKADMMRMPERWTKERAPLKAVRTKCLAAGMTEQDTAKVVDLLGKAQAGRRLVPRAAYKNFTFQFPVK